MTLKQLLKVYENIKINYIYITDYHSEETILKEKFEETEIKNLDLKSLNFELIRLNENAEVDSIRFYPKGRYHNFTALYLEIFAEYI